jgi:hypothetical protein
MALRGSGSSSMRDDQIQRIQAIQQSMEESARSAFDDQGIQDLRVLVRLVVQFYEYLTSALSSDDPFRDKSYEIDSVFFNIESFCVVTHFYGVLVGSRTSTIDWNAISIPSLKERFVSLFHDFIAETKFENKCRLLLDLVKLQIVYAGAFYDCSP